MVSSSRHVFHYAPFRNLFFARLLTVLGNGIAPIALAFAVLDIGGSAADLGLVVAARSIFNVAFLLIGGVLADRYSRSKVLLSSSVIAALSQGIVAWLVLDGTATIMWLAVLGTINGAAAGIALPASSAMVPQTVPARNLREANAFIQLGIYGGTVIGASLGGVLTAAIGPGWGLAVDALGFAASAPLYLLIRTASAQLLTSQTNILQDLRDGWQEFIARAWVWTIVAQFTVVNAAFSGVVMILGPIVADASFGRASWGIIVAAQSIGLIAGSFIALRWRPRRDLFIGVILVALCAIPITLLSMVSSTAILMVAFFIAGVGFGQFGVVWAHSLQTHIPPEKLARVYAYDAMGSFVAIPIGELAAGPLAMHYGSRAVLLASAVAVVIATIAASLTPAIRRLDNAAQVKQHI
ncbi:MULTISPECIES: MFS transporter [Yersinia]|jgi:MFS family permease|uniref:MFS transporter n=1 Tax=Yersinia intermedia TaxID=631 RepID=A0A0T9MZK8_YERIN|nr:MULTISPECIES: MFS transporter [Yersinia]AJJ17290.1 sugar (and other) transporter family protein [Yersinia intermedia]ARB86851.1 MFS transporter [Yersinia sp. FDAARGOS_228]AVL36302.1 MFS transporter [Yersinia intermedia]MCB5300355.1 MFS transporter [Yersinia intermedia]MDA5482714.1 MFS transporter [Yersinia intermedia]